MAFDGSSNRTTVTKEYAKRMGLQQLSCKTSAMGLGQTEATPGNMYVVKLVDSQGKEHRLEAMAVPFIYTN